MRPLLASYMVQAQHKAGLLGLSNVELLHGDVMSEHVAVSLRDAAAFDVITCSSAMIYLPDVPAALRRFASWLVPGGQLVFNSPQVFISPYIPALTREQVFAALHGQPTGAASAGSALEHL